MLLPLNGGLAALEFVVYFTVYLAVVRPRVFFKTGKNFGKWHLSVLVQTANHAKA